MERLTIPRSLAEWNERGRDYLPRHLGIECLAVEPDEVRMRMRVEPRKCAWNGFLHAGTVVSLADTACGYATVRNLPEDASGFTTLELKSNFLGTTLEGDVICVARRPQGPHDPGLGRRGPRGADRQDDRALSLHADDPAIARLTARSSAPRPSGAPGPLAVAGGFSSAVRSPRPPLRRSGPVDLRGCSTKRRR